MWIYGTQDGYDVSRPTPSVPNKGVCLGCCEAPTGMWLWKARQYVYWITAFRYLKGSRVLHVPQLLQFYGLPRKTRCPVDSGMCGW